MGENENNGEITREARKILGQKMKALRLMRGLNQEDVAFALGYSSSGTISQVESGEIFMKQEKIYRAAEFFQIPAAALMMPIEMDEEQLAAMIDFLALIKTGKNSPHYKTIITLIEMASKDLPK